MGSVEPADNAEEKAVYCQLWYYTSYFKNALIFMDHLNYPYAFASHEEIISLFTKMFLFSPDEIFSVTRLPCFRVSH